MKLFMKVSEIKSFSKASRRFSAPQKSILFVSFSCFLWPQWSHFSFKGWTVSNEWPSSSSEAFGVSFWGYSCSRRSKSPLRSFWGLLGGEETGEEIQKPVRLEWGRLLHLGIRKKDLLRWVWRRGWRRGGQSVLESRRWGIQLSMAKTGY